MKFSIKDFFSKCAQIGLLLPKLISGRGIGHSVQRTMSPPKLIPYFLPVLFQSFFLVASTNLAQILKILVLSIFFFWFLTILPKLFSKSMSYFKKLYDSSDVVFVNAK